MDVLKTTIVVHGVVENGCVEQLRTVAVDSSIEINY